MSNLDGSRLSISAEEYLDWEEIRRINKVIDKLTKQNEILKAALEKIISVEYEGDGTIEAEVALSLAEAVK